MVACGPPKKKKKKEKGNFQTEVVGSSPISIVYFIFCSSIQWFLFAPGDSIRSVSVCHYSLPGVRFNGQARIC